MVQHDVGDYIIIGFIGLVMIASILIPLYIGLALFAAVWRIIMRAAYPPDESFDDMRAHVRDYDDPPPVRKAPIKWL